MTPQGHCGTCFTKIVVILKSFARLIVVILKSFARLAVVVILKSFARLAGVFFLVLRSFSNRLLCRTALGDCVCIQIS